MAAKTIRLEVRRDGDLYSLSFVTDYNERYGLKADMCSYGFEDQTGIVLKKGQSKVFVVSPRASRAKVRG